MTTPSNAPPSNSPSPTESESSPSPKSGYSGMRWGVLLVLAAIQFTHILDFVIIMPLGDRLRHQLKIDPQKFGIVVSAYGLAAMITGIVTASLVDRYDRRSVLIVSFAGFTLSTFYCGVAPDYLNLLIARCLAGLFGGMASSSVMAVIGDLYHDQQRGKAIGVVSSSFAVASTIGLPIGLWLANHFESWNAPFLAIGSLAILVLGLAMISLPSIAGHRTEVQVDPWTKFSSVVRVSNHLWAFAFMMMTIFGTFIIVPYLAPYLQANCNQPAMNIPVIYAVAGVCTLITMNLIGWATDRIGARPMFLFCASGAVIMTLVITNLPVVSLLGAVVAASSFMILASGRIIPAQAMILRASDPALRGAFMNLNTAVSHFATAVGPLISGAIVGEEYEGGPLTRYAVSGLIAAGCGCAAIAIVFRLRPFRASTLET